VKKELETLRKDLIKIKAIVESVRKKIEDMLRM